MTTKTNITKISKKSELGGSILKHVEGYEMSTEFENCKVNVKDFPGGNVIASLGENPDYILFRVGTNELSSKKYAEEIAIRLLI